MRVEIEKLEGRKRSIDTEVRLSTITLDLIERRPLVTATFSEVVRGAKRALGDTVDVAAAIAVVALRLTGVLLPVFVLVVLPGGLVLRVVTRRLSNRGSARGARVGVP